MPSLVEEKNRRIGGKIIHVFRKNKIVSFAYRYASHPQVPSFSCISTISASLRRSGVYTYAYKKRCKSKKCLDFPPSFHRKTSTKIRTPAQTKTGQAFPHADIPTKSSTMHKRSPVFILPQVFWPHEVGGQQAPVLSCDQPSENCCEAAADGVVLFPPPLTSRRNPGNRRWYALRLPSNSLPRHCVPFCGSSSVCCRESIETVQPRE